MYRLAVPIDRLKLMAHHTTLRAQHRGTFCWLGEGEGSFRLEASNAAGMQIYIYISIPCIGPLSSLLLQASLVFHLFYKRDGLVRTLTESL